MFAVQSASLRHREPGPDPFRVSPVIKTLRTPESRATSTTILRGNAAPSFIFAALGLSRACAKLAVIQATRRRLARREERCCARRRAVVAMTITAP